MIMIGGIEEGGLMADFMGFSSHFLWDKRVTQRRKLLALRVCLLRGGLFTFTIMGEGKGRIGTRGLGWK